MVRVDDEVRYFVLRAEVAAHYKPVGFEEELRCEEIAVAIWQRRRLLRYDVDRSPAILRSIGRSSVRRRGRQRAMLV